jgi:hypothetical protein
LTIPIGAETDGQTNSVAWLRIWITSGRGAMLTPVHVIAVPRGPAAKSRAAAATRGAGTSARAATYSGV